jgi:hypothetical protein
MRHRVLLKFGGTALIARPLLPVGYTTRRLTSRADVHDYPLAKIPRKPLTYGQAIRPAATGG